MTTKTTAALAKAQDKAYESFKEVADAAFKIDGMRGVIDAAITAQDQLKASLGGGYSDAKLTKALSFLADMWTPLTLARLAEVEKAGGMEAFKAAQAKGKK